MSVKLELIRAFLGLRRVKGLCIREFPLIPSHMVETLAQGPRSLHQSPRVDLVCFEVEEVRLESFEELTLRGLRDLLKQATGRTVWVLEANNKLTRDVIGDVLFDRNVLPLCYPELAVNARFGVIVGEADKLYLEIARSLGIEVFVVSPRQPRKLKCREINGVLCVDLGDEVPTPLRTASSIYRHIERYLKGENVKEVVESMLPVKVEVLNTVIAYWKNEPRCEVLVDEEGNTTINYCSEPCVIVVYQPVPGEKHSTRIIAVKNESPITRWAKNSDKEVRDLKHK